MHAELSFHKVTGRALSHHGIRKAFLQGVAQIMKPDLLGSNVAVYSHLNWKMFL